AVRRGGEGGDGGGRGGVKADEQARRRREGGAPGVAYAPGGRRGALTGDPGKDTPLFTFVSLSRSRDAVSNPAPVFRSRPALRVASSSTSTSHPRERARTAC